MMINDRGTPPNLHIKMAGNDPIHNIYSYRPVDSPDDDEDDPNQQNYELFDDFLVSDDWLNEDQASIVFGYHDDPVYASGAIEVGNQSVGSSSSSSHIQENSTMGSGTMKGEKVTKEKVAFKTKSDIEVLDDGFKWRKYGKKMVKNSPNPRNYYRCSAEGCSVKKRVERDIEDPRYVITTYMGVHNHEGPSKI